MSVFSISQINQLLNILQKSFQETNQKKNWKILKIIVYILSDNETFGSFFNPSIPEIAMLFLQPSSDQNCIIQALFLLNIITERTEFRISYEQIQFLLSLLQFSFTFSDFKQLVLNIIKYHIDKEIPEELAQEIYEKTKLVLINEVDNLSAQSFSLRLIGKILQKGPIIISNDDLELYYSYANSKIVDIAIDGLKLFIDYAQNQNNMNQIIECDLIKHILDIYFFKNHKVSKYAFIMFEIISSHGEIGSKTVYDNLTISNFFSYSYSIQKSILKIIYNFTEYKIINELLQVSKEAFEFVVIFLETDVDSCILLSLNILHNLQSSLVDLFNMEIINTLEQLTFHDNEQISTISKSLLDFIKLSTAK